MALEVTAMQGFFCFLSWDAFSFWALFSQSTDRRTNIPVMVWKAEFLKCWRIDGYDLKICVLKFKCWSPDAQCDGIRRNRWEALPSWTDEHLLRGSRALAPSSRWAHGEKAPAAHQEMSSPQWKHAGFLILLAASGSIRNKPLLFISYPCYGTLL